MINKFGFTDRELGDQLGVSDRRIRQLAQDDCLVSLGPGRWDITHALNYRLGERVLKGRGAKPQDKFTTAAAGWLMCHDNHVSKNELKLWLEAAARWGLNQHEAHTLLVNAAALLGKSAPVLEI